MQNASKLVNMNTLYKSIDDISTGNSTEMDFTIDAQNYVQPSNVIVEILRRHATLVFSFLLIKFFV